MELKERELDQCFTTMQKIRESIEQVVVGKHDSIVLMLTAMLCNGHVLIEDVPGMGKTLMVNSLAASTAMSFRRIQCTPDMLPSDIVGFTMYDINSGRGSFRPGPIMSQLLLVDEINRTSPKTQAALLEAMEENQVTVDGETYELPRPFMVLATQNPIESVGTFLLPEAQMDRFLMRISLGYPSRSEEKRIMRRFNQTNPLKTLTAVTDAQEIMTVQAAVPYIKVSEAVENYILSIAQATRDNEFISLGVSPRGSLSLMKCAQAFALLQGKPYVVPEDVRTLAVYVLSHRIMLSKDAVALGRSKEQVLKSILKKTEIPVR